MHRSFCCHRQIPLFLQRRCIHARIRPLIQNHGIHDTLPYRRNLRRTYFWTKHLDNSRWRGLQHVHFETGRDSSFQDTCKFLHLRCQYRVGYVRFFLFTSFGVCSNSGKGKGCDGINNSSFDTAQGVKQSSHSKTTQHSPRDVYHILAFRKTWIQYTKRILLINHHGLWRWRCHRHWCNPRSRLVQDPTWTQAHMTISLFFVFHHSCGHECFSSNFQRPFFLRHFFHFFP
mmetsp:Transcript_6293/g.9128  ORF Transcript_6293/g.9128 Transcript_6293/m.9128 type:complete len:230 (+) Transcript_6293:1785-2474(+)